MARPSVDLMRVVVFLLIANAPFWILAEHFFVLRPLVNADVIAAMLLWAVSPAAGMAALLLVWTIEGLQSLSLVYHFASPIEFARSAQYAGSLRWSDFVSASTIQVGLHFSGFLLLIWLLHRRWKPRPLAVCGVALVLVAVDVANGSGLAAVMGRDRLVVQANVSGSPAMNLAVASVQSAQRGSRPLRPWPESRGAELVDWAAAHQGNVFVVIVESWGLHREPAVQQWLLSHLVDKAVSDRWAVQADQEDFEGSTTAGELRVLCGLAGHYRRLTHDDTRRCMPNALRRLGYETHGLHGFTGKMFDRTTWWPSLGLDHITFGDTMPADTPKCGGAFRGICDSAMVHQAEGLLKGERRFVYLLTLNTHLPLTVQALPADLVALCDRHNLDAAACQLTAQLGALFDHIRTLLHRLPSPPLVTVVGDHSPPFLVQTTRSQYSASAVPRIVLTPR